MPEAGLLFSPSLARDSIVFSRLPLRPFKTVAFLLSSGKPISFKMFSFCSNDALKSPTLAPNTRDCLFICTGGEREPYVSDRGEVGLDDLPEDRGKCEADDTERRPNPNNFPVLGGSGGGEPSGDLV